MPEGGQGPNVDQYGRWVTDPTKYPPGANGEDGIAVLADYVHSLGEKFGIYVTPGISKQAVAENTPIEGTTFTADSIATKTRQNNYNCGGMVGVNFNKPGAQAYVNSIVDQYAGWGVDYIKLDGITNQNSADIKAWSDAIRQSGRPMQLDITEGSYTPKLGPLLDQYATQWEYSSDIEAYGTPGLTDYTQVKKRFNTLALWEPTYGGSQYNGYNDFDSVEVGNCTDPVSATTAFGHASYTNGDGLDVSRAPDRPEPVVACVLADHPGHRPDSALPAGSGSAEEQGGPRPRSGRHRCVPDRDPERRASVAKTTPSGAVAVGLFNTGLKQKTALGLRLDDRPAAEQHRLSGR